LQKEVTTQEEFFPEGKQEKAEPEEVVSQQEAKNEVAMPEPEAVEQEKAQPVDAPQPTLQKEVTTQEEFFPEGKQEKAEPEEVVSQQEAKNEVAMPEPEAVEQEKAQPVDAPQPALQKEEMAPQHEVTAQEPEAPRVDAPQPALQKEAEEEQEQESPKEALFQSQTPFEAALQAEWKKAFVTEEPSKPATEQESNENIFQKLWGTIWHTDKQKQAEPKIACNQEPLPPTPSEPAKPAEAPQRPSFVALDVLPSASPNAGQNDSKSDKQKQAEPKIACNQEPLPPTPSEPAKPTVTPQRPSFVALDVLPSASPNAGQNDSKSDKQKQAEPKITCNQEPLPPASSEPAKPTVTPQAPSFVALDILPSVSPQAVRENSKGKTSQAPSFVALDVLPSASPQVAQKQPEAKIACSEDLSAGDALEPHCVAVDILPGVAQANERTQPEKQNGALKNSEPQQTPNKDKPDTSTNNLFELETLLFPKTFGGNELESKPESKDSMGSQDNKDFFDEVSRMRVEAMDNKSKEKTPQQDAEKEDEELALGQKGIDPVEDLGVDESLDTLLGEAEALARELQAAPEESVQAQKSEPQSGELTISKEASL
jgi:hypothetical protein